MNITELSIRRPITTIMLFVSMVVIGLIASFRLPLEAEPEASIPFFFVQLPYAGSTSEEVERNLVRPVEEALATMPGIESMNSRANAEGGSVQVRFSDWNKDIAIAASEARERIDAIRDQLPDDFRRYFVFRWSTSDREALSLRLTSSVDLTTRADLIERSIKQRLERLPGVARVEVEGVAKQEVLVALDKDRLNAHGVALNALVQQLQAANFSVSAGEISEAGRRLRVQPRGELLELQQLRDLRIDQRGTRLSDVADIDLKPQRMDYVRRMDGKPSVGVDIYKERSANLVDLSRSVRAEIAELEKDPATRWRVSEVEWDYFKLYDKFIGPQKALAGDPAANVALAPFDYLVIAVGVGANYFGHPEWQTLAKPLKSLSDALEIREQLLNSFEQAQTEADPEKRRALLTCVIAGGGPTGVEMAGAIAELWRETRIQARVKDETLAVRRRRTRGGRFRVRPRRRIELRASVRGVARVVFAAARSASQPLPAGWRWRQ